MGSSKKGQYLPRLIYMSLCVFIEYMCVCACVCAYNDTSLTYNSRNMTYSFFNAKKVIESKDDVNVIMPYSKAPLCNIVKHNATLDYILGNCICMVR